MSGRRPGHSRPTPPPSRNGNAAAAPDREGTAAGSTPPDRPPHGMPGDAPDDTRRTEITITVDVVDDDNVTRRVIAAYTAADPETVWRLLRIALRSGATQTHGHSAHHVLDNLRGQAAGVIDQIETARTQRGGT